MPKVELEITDDQYTFLQNLSSKLNKTVTELVGEWLKPILEEKRVEIAVKEYKEGRLNAKEAWKLSGLTFAEFLRKVES